MLWLKNATWIFIQHKPFEQKLKASYTLKNLERIKLIQSWDRYRHRTMPEFLKIFRESELGYQVPPGILWTLWQDHIENASPHLPFYQPEFRGTLREDQLNAIRNLMKRPVGLMNAGTGTGKSYMILSLVPKLQRNTLIVVTATTTLTEMVEKCEMLLGTTPIVVWGKKKYKPTRWAHITVCMLQSLDKLNLHDYGAILADECDVCISTPARQKFWFECAPDYFYGFTATLKINQQEDRLIHLFFGDAEKSMLGNNFKPRIHQVWTEYEYSGVLDSNAEFSKMMTEISEDPARNNLIVQTIYETLKKSETKKGIVLVKRVEQWSTLQALLLARGIQSRIIVGDTPNDERARIKEEVATSLEPIVLIGSAQILGRGFDLPSLQLAYIVYPNRFDAALIQVVGRVLRKSPGKTYAEVFDFTDALEDALMNQAYSRWRTYRKEYWVSVQRLLLANE